MSWFIATNITSSVTIYEYINMAMLLIDKPKNITSHDVVYFLRKTTGIKKIGHAGTLDPMATGLLICAIEREYTKKLEDLTKNSQKTYIAEIFLGKETDTLDSEGEIISENIDIKPNLQEVKEILKKFQGKISQIPPIYSAIKINGKKAYDLARRGKEVKLKARNIEIYEIKLIKYKYPTLKIECKVSSGTYIRSLARDIGKKLKTGAYLSDLRRTKIGKFDIKNAYTIEEINKDNWKNLEINLY